MKKSRLFDTMTLQNRPLRNRLAVAPMTRRSATSEGIPTPEMIAYYGSFSSGGFGLILTEGTYTDPFYSQSDENQPGLTNQEQMRGWAKVVDQVHQSGALIISQLMHAGALSQYRNTTIAPSAVQPAGLRSTEEGGLRGAFPLPKEMDETDFNQVKTGFVQAAVLAQTAGFDGVEIHAANGYLFDQFITEHTNVRHDQYGGSVRNRLRFLMEVYAAIKENVSADFIVGIRLSESKVNDLTYRWPGGSETAAGLFAILAEIKAGYLHIAAEGGNWARECLYPDGLSSTGLAKKITGVPVIANGGLHDTALATSLIDTDQADFISIGKAAIANPDWPKRMAAGQPVVPFFKELIKPSLTLKHTEAVLSRMKQEQ